MDGCGNDGMLAAVCMQIAIGDLCGICEREAVETNGRPYFI
jgi:hypothetical protein